MGRDGMLAVVACGIACIDMLDHSCIYFYLPLATLLETSHVVCLFLFFFFFGIEALSARQTIAELWDGRLRGGHWSG